VGVKQDVSKEVSKDCVFKGCVKRSSFTLPVNLRIVVQPPALVAQPPVTVLCASMAHSSGQRASAPPPTAWATLQTILIKKNFGIHTEVNTTQP